MPPPTGYARAVSSMFWPVAQIATAAFMITDDEVKAAKAGKLEPADKRYRGKPVANALLDHVHNLLATLPKLLVAGIVYYYYFPKDLSAFRSLELNAALWAAAKPIFIRDLVLTWIAAGFWDFVVYFSPLADKFAANKFNPEPAKWSQRLHDMFWTHVSTAVSTAFEVLVLHWYATGAYPAHEPVVWWKDAATLLWILTMPYWRLTHFFFLHRGMHPWRTERVPDIGAFLYRWVHSLHHKSKNPIAWSGVSMHPVESIGYYTALLIPVVAGAWTSSLLTKAGVLPLGAAAWLGAHPIIMLYTKFDLTMAALIGHDGFGYPGGGSQPHWLHHNNFECNYGESIAPWDNLFGSFAADEEDFDAKFGHIMAGKGAGKGKKAA